MEFQWWCAAQNEPWSWTWRAYPGVWAAVLVALFVYRRALAAGEVNREKHRLAVRAGYIGIFLLWISLDWPVGALGAGYLVSFHSSKFLLLAFVIPPLLWMPFHATPPPSLRSLFAGKRVDAPKASRPSIVVPLLSAIFFNAVLVSTHTPALVNSFSDSQLGSFAVDAIWLTAGLVFWRPVVLTGILPHQLIKMLYVFVGTISHTLLGMFLLLNRLPLYTIFELAPRVHHLADARTDQGLAGAVMLLLGTPLIFLAEILLFTQWYRSQNPAKR